MDFGGNSYLRRLAEIESGFDPYARNPNSSAKGLFQFLDKTGQEYGINAPFGTPDYTQQETKAAEALTANNREVLRQKLGREPTNGELYLAHQQGASGANALLQNPNQPAVSALASLYKNPQQAQQAVVNNGGTPDMLAGDFANQWTNKFEQQTPVAQNESDLVDVELPDGTLIEGVPANISRADLVARLKRNGYDTSGLEGQDQTQPVVQTESAPTQQTAAEKTPEAKGFLERFGEDFEKRAQQYADISESYNAGKQNLLRSTGQVIGNVGLGSFNDLIGEGLVSAGRGLSYLTPDSIEQPLKVAAGGALQAVGEALPAGNGKSLAEQLPKDLETVGNWYKSLSPEVQRDLGAVGNATMLAPFGRATQAVKQVEKEAGLMVKGGVMPSSTVKDVAGQYYKAAEEAGGTIKGDKAFTMFENMANKVIPKDPKDVKALQNEGYFKTYKELEDAYMGEDLSLENLINIDQRLTADAQKFKVSDPNSSRLIKDMQEEVRKLRDSVAEGDLRNPEGFGLYKKGVELYAKSKRMETIETIIRRASEKEQPSTAIKNALIALRENPKKYAGFTAAEKRLVDRAIKTGAIEGLMRTLGSRLPTVGALSTGAVVGPAALPLAAATYGGSALARMGANSMRMGRVRNILKEIQPNDLRPPTAPFKKKVAPPVVPLEQRVEKSFNTDTGLSYKQALEEINKRPRTVDIMDVNAPERVALQKDVVSKVLQEQRPPGGFQRGKTAEIILGPPGAGKSSTIASELRQKLGAIEVDSDLIKTGLPEFDKGLGANAVHEESKIATDRLLNAASKQGFNIVHPVIGTKPEKVAKLIDDLRTKGYTINVRLVNVSPETSVERVIDRYAKSGRAVPLDYVQSIGDKPLKTYEALKTKEGVNAYTYIDNSGPEKVIKESTDRNFPQSGVRPRSGLRLPGQRTGNGPGQSPGGRSESALNKLANKPKTMPSALSNMAPKGLALGLLSTNAADDNRREK